MYMHFEHKEMSTGTMAFAHSFPERTAPSIDARYFCFIKSPAMKKLLMGDLCNGQQYGSQFGTDLYTDL
jgi:hypothetical protein